MVSNALVYSVKACQVFGSCSNYCRLLLYITPYTTRVTVMELGADRECDQINLGRLSREYMLPSFSEASGSL